MVCYLFSKHLYHTSHLPTLFLSAFYVIRLNPYSSFSTYQHLCCIETLPRREITCVAGLGSHPSKWKAGTQTPQLASRVPVPAPTLICEALHRALGVTCF